MGKLGDILRTHGPEYRRRFEERMSLDQIRAMHAIETCHTPAAGSALWRCTSCGHGHFTYQVYISESAILQHDEKGITLRYRKSETNQPRTLRLEPMEFLRRFLQHVLP
ncbi:MAG: transposase [Kiritimatiellae bacterium]|nr:transposase [Kiritimatiellia bacterium]